MREILFRGKTEDGKWFEGYLLGGTYYYDDKPMTTIIPIDNMFYPRCEISSWEKVLPETVGQYIGLRDKNGKKIFEGDILESPVKRIGQEFGNLIAITDIRECKFIALYVNEYEVVGNFYDNPEIVNILLEKGV